MNVNAELFERAIFLLATAAEWIDKNADPSGTLFYDDADCDGYCLMDELRLMVDDLREAAPFSPTVKP